GPLLSALPDRFLALHPGSGSPAKNWPPGRYASLARARAGGRPWLLVEGPADAEAARSLAGEAGAVRAHGLDARVLGALLARAGLVVGNDSGVTHLAAACGAPTLALFGPTDPLQWAPLGTRVEALRAPGGAMDTLSLEVVLEAATRLT
ncbi:MAG TPA: glycosyltransferase family 9 protein, partial [Vicinamibacteria bacterium]|nr:glycosyltransferase family 9 protein [Vicinamibacteria bacterium]